MASHAHPLEEALETIRADHAPDPRLAAWDVRIAEGGTRIEGWAPSEEALAALAALAEEAGARLTARALPDPELGGAVRGIAHRAVAHLRLEPSHGSELVSQMILGEEALVLRAEGDWLQVQTGDRYVAWVHGGSVVRTSPADRAAFLTRLWAREPEPGAWVVTDRGVVAREAPDPLSTPVAPLVEGARIAVQAPDGRTLHGRALQIALPDGVRGFVPAGAAVPADRLAERFTPGGRAILDHGARFLGLPYLWGGASELGFDCSGFVQRIYGLHGIRLPRDTDQQAACGDVVEPGEGWTEVVDGDLAFFAERPGRVTHVGILAAGGRLLHCSTTRHGVARDALASGDPGRSDYGAWLAERLVAVRRPRPEGTY